MTISEYQFGVTLLMGLLTIIQFLILPIKNERHAVFENARWLLTGGTLLLTIHFFLQYWLGYRSHGEITKSVFLNLLFFMPTSWLFNVSMLYLLRNGRLHLWEWLAGPLLYGASVMILITSILLAQDLQGVKNAEYAVSVIYAITLICYNVQEYKEFNRIRRIRDKYLDHSMNLVSRWFGTSLGAMIVLVLLSPIIIFSNRPIILIPTTLLMIAAIFFYVLCFICFGVSESNVMAKKEEDERKAVELPKTLTKNEESNDERVEQAIRKWLDERGHLKPGLTIQNAVEEMHLPRYLLVRWIKNTKYEVFSRWITHLRVEEAKRLLTVHPEYSNDAVAHECGFSTRSYFQKVFREQTGMTPLEYQNKCLKG